MIECFGSEPIGGREGAIEMGEITRIGERGHLVNDDLGARFEDDRSDCFPVESVHHSRGRAGPLQRLDLRGERVRPVTL